MDSVRSMNEIRKMEIQSVGEWELKSDHPLIDSEIAIKIATDALLHWLSDWWNKKDDSCNSLQSSQTTETKKKERRKRGKREARIFWVEPCLIDFVPFVIGMNVYSYLYLILFYSYLYVSGKEA